jgi:hypothetical protein
VEASGSESICGIQEVPLGRPKHVPLIYSGNDPIFLEIRHYEAHVLFKKTSRSLSRVTPRSKLFVGLIPLQHLGSFSLFTAFSSLFFLAWKKRLFECVYALPLAGNMCAHLSIHQTSIQSLIFLLEQLENGECAICLIIIYSSDLW